MTDSVLRCVGGPFDGKKKPVPPRFRVGDQVQFMMPPRKDGKDWVQDVVSYLIIVERPSATDPVLRYIDGR